MRSLSERWAIRKLVDDLYAAGAPNISCIDDMMKEQNVEVVTHLAVTMPSDPEEWKKVVVMHNAFWKSYLGEDAEDDLEDFWSTTRCRSTSCSTSTFEQTPDRSSLRCPGGSSGPP